MDFAAYVHDQRRALLRFATVLTGQTWLAEDLVDAVLARAYERWERISATERPHAYVRRMLVNEHVSWHRRRRYSVPTDDLEQLSTPLADGTAEHAERDAMIARLQRLPARQRSAVALRYYAGCSDAEIAAELGCRQSTVRSQIARALAALRIELPAPDAAPAAPIPVEIP